MKWFKHDSNALHDAKIEKLIMKHGIEGYGLYFACIEIIANELTSENITFELEHDAEILAYKFKIDTLKVEEIMKYCVNLGLFQYNIESGRMACYKLASRLDKTMSQSIGIREITTSKNFQKLPKTSSNQKQIRLDKNRLEENKEDTVTTAAQQDKKDKEKELGKKAKQCLKYYFDKHKEVRGFDPMVVGGRDMKLFKEIIKSGYEIETFKTVTDYFFAYSKRANFTTKALYNSFDTLYGVLKDKEEGRR